MIFEKLANYESIAQLEKDFFELMRRSLQLNNSSNQESRWARLPGLCCQAAGGDESLADYLAAAWMLFYRAAHIMDSIEDQDQPEQWWLDLGPATAINVASGLFFTAAQTLNNLFLKEGTRLQAQQVIDRFFQGFIAMCAGQQLDLVTSSPELEQAWEIARYKSGAFFGLATLAGAQLATRDPEKLAAYESYGRNIGLLVQVKDDLEEINALGSLDLWINPHKLRKSIPIVYAYEVITSVEKKRLSDLLASINENPIATKEFLKLIDKSGAVLYLATEMERLQSKAFTALERSQALEPARSELVGLVTEFKLIM